MVDVQEVWGELLSVHEVWGEVVGVLEGQVCRLRPGE